MNILFLTTHLNTGGITSYLLTLGKGLRGLGHEVHIASSGGNMEKEFLFAGIKLFRVNIWTKSELAPRIYWALNPLARYIRDHRIAIIHGQTRITQVMGVFLAWSCGCSFVSTCHGFFKPRLFRKLFPCWGEFVIAISPAVEEHLLHDFAVQREKVVLIENGIDLENFVPVDDLMKKIGRQRFDLGEGPVLGMIARFSDVKGQDILVEAMGKVVSQIPNAKLLLVGEGKTEGLLRGMVDRLDLKDHVRFFSIVNRTSEMLALFDIFIMPSRQEGLGLSIMEAQAAGVAVVASRVGGIPSLIEDGKTGVLVDSGNSFELAEAIVRTLRNPARLKEIGARGREFIQKNYSAGRMTQKTVELYERVLFKHGRDRSW